MNKLFYFLLYFFLFSGELIFNNSIKQDLRAREEISSAVCLGHPPIINHIASYLNVLSRAYFSQVNKNISTAIKSDDQQFFQKFDKFEKILHRLLIAINDFKTLSPRHEPEIFKTYIQIKKILGNAPDLLPTLKLLDRSAFFLQTKKEKRKTISLLLKEKDGEESFDILWKILKEIELFSSGRKDEIEEIQINSLKSRSIFDIKAEIEKNIIQKNEFISSFKNSQEIGEGNNFIRAETFNEEYISHLKKKIDFFSLNNDSISQIKNEKDKFRFIKKMDAKVNEDSLFPTNFFIKNLYLSSLEVTFFLFTIMILKYLKNRENQERRHRKYP
jgi:hypothetical protein